MKIDKEEIGQIAWDYTECKEDCAKLEKRILDLFKVEDEFKIGQEVYHKDIYNGKELMKVVGIRKKELELEGDYSGGTHLVCQKDWMPIEGIILNN